MEIQQGWYKHYTGNYLKIIDIVQYLTQDYHSEEIIYEDKLGILWSQPLETFFGMVQLGNRKIPKVTYVGERVPNIIVAG